MIIRLQNFEQKTAIKIHSVFQESYSIEAKLLGIKDFAPLRRPIEHFKNSKNEFFGFIDSEIIAGIIEIEDKETFIDINSLVVKPDFFRRGVGKGLLKFVFSRFGFKRYIVETAVNNLPATELYKKLGFNEVKQWDTDFGMRKVQFEKIYR